MRDHTKLKAFGSLRELHYQFMLAERLNYVEKSEIKENKQKITETEKVLGALIRALHKC